MNRKIVISINTAWNVYNFRAGLIKALLRAGYEPVALAPADEYVPKIKKLGCRFIDVRMDSNGMSPRRDLALLLSYHCILRRERPMAYLGYTIKPNIYGSLAANALRIPVINNIAGLGATFIGGGPVMHLVRGLYQVSLHRSHRVLFQNPDDRALFIESGLVQQQRSDLVAGSGMDLARFSPMPAPPEPRPFRFLLIARMLRDKGLQEFADAARTVKARFSNVEFCLLGALAEGNPNAIAPALIAQWEREGVVRHLGTTDDVRPYLAQADCVVLPSYREGVPRCLLEAAAMARPLITTNVVGCREVVEDQINGFLCEPKSADDLARKMFAMLALPVAARMSMGAAGRNKVARQFDEQSVIQKYLEVLLDIEMCRQARGCPKTMSAPNFRDQET